MKNFNEIKSKIFRYKTDNNSNNRFDDIEKSIFKSICDSMECNGYSYFNNTAFANKTDEPCYIPENGTTIEDIYTYNDLLNLVCVWTSENPEYTIEHQTTPEAILQNMYENITHEFPSTFLEQLDY